jgi:hypothetical protein
MKTYHIGFVKGSGRCFPLHDNGHNVETLVVEMRRSLDALSCDIWHYVGEFETTKKQVFLDRFALLRKFNHRNETAFKRIIID